MCWWPKAFPLTRVCGMCFSGFDTIRKPAIVIKFCFGSSLSASWWRLYFNIPTTIMQPAVEMHVNCFRKLCVLSSSKFLPVDTFNTDISSRNNSEYVGCPRLLGSAAVHPSCIARYNAQWMITLNTLHTHQVPGCLPSLLLLGVQLFAAWPLSIHGDDDCSWALLFSLHILHIYQHLTPRCWGVLLCNNMSQSIFC